MCVHFLRPQSIADCRAAACENVLIMKVFCPDSEGEEAGDRGDRAHTEPLRIGLYHSFPALSYAYHYKDANPVRTRRFGTWHLARLRPMADFQYILPGAVGLPRGSNLYLWNPHIICGRTSMCNGHQSSVRGAKRVPGVDGAFALRGDSRELSDRPGGLL